MLKGPECTLIQLLLDWIFCGLGRPWCNEMQCHHATLLQVHLETEADKLAEMHARLQHLYEYILLALQVQFQTSLVTLTNPCLHSPTR